MHDQTLLTQWHRKRDGEAFHELTRKYAGMTYATALRILRNPHDAEDVAQRCFETLASNRRAPGDALGPWLHRVAVNAALDWRKRETRRAVRETTYHEAQPQSATPQWDDVYPLVDEAIAALPEKLRRAVVGHYLEQRTHAELAAEEGISREAMTQRVHRGVEQVRTALRKRGVSVPAAVLGAMFGNDLARAAEPPLALKGRLGQIAVSGFSATGARLIPALSPAAIIALTAVLVAGGSAIIWLASGGDSTNTFEAGAPRRSTPASVAALGPESGAEERADPTVSLAAIGSRPAALSTALSGRVYDAETGHGIDGAKVVVASANFRNELETDADGRFSVPQLPPGAYYVACHAANGYFIPREAGDDQPVGTRFNISADETIAPLEIPLDRGEVITGRLIDASGVPVAGATVTGGVDYNQLHLTNTTTSGPDGAFAVSGFPPTLEAWVWAESDALVSASSGPLAVPVSGPGGVDIVLQPKATIRGSVVYASGKGAPGMEVQPQYRPNVSVRKWVVRTDDDGNFEVANLPAGSLLLKAWDGSSILNDPSEFTITPGELRDGMELLCPVGDTRILGRVVNSAGKGLAGTRLTCWSEVHQGERSASSESDGRFLLDGLDPGRYLLRAERYGEYMTVLLPGVESGSGSIEIVLEDVPRVQGRVVDARTGAPIPKFQINTASNLSDLARGKSFKPMEEAQGRYSVSLDALDTNYIAVRAPGYRVGQAVAVASKPGELMEIIDIRLQAQSDIRGNVIDEAGDGVPYASVYSGSQLQRPDEDFFAARAEQDGTFVLPAQLLADDIITVTHPEYGPVTVAITEKNLLGETVEITLLAGASVTCDTYVDSRPATDVEITLSCVNCAQGGFIAPVAAGQFSALAEGWYSLGVFLKNTDKTYGASRQEHFTLTKNEHRDFRMELQTGTAALECILSDEGTATTLLMLEVATTQGAQRYFGEADGGTFNFKNLPAGRGYLIAEPLLDEVDAIRRHRYTVDLQAGMLSTLELNSIHSSRLRGRIKKFNGGDNSRIFVLFGEIDAEKVTTGTYSFERDFCGGIPVSPDGTFDIPALTPDTYTLASFTEQNGETLWLAYAVVTLGEEDISVELQPLL